MSVAASHKKLTVKINGPDYGWTEEYALGEIDFDAADTVAKKLLDARSRLFHSSVSIVHAVMTDAAVKRASRIANNYNAIPVLLDAEADLTVQAVVNNDGVGMLVRFETANGEHSTRLLRGIRDSWVSDNKLVLVQPALAITDVSIGLSQFTVAGAHTLRFPPGGTFAVAGSTANDGAYTVANSEVVAGSTVITVNEVIADATVDGDVTGGETSAALDPYPVGGPYLGATDPPTYAVDPTLDAACDVVANFLSLVRDYTYLVQPTFDLDFPYDLISYTQYEYLRISSRRNGKRFANTRGAQPAWS